MIAGLVTWFFLKRENLPLFATVLTGIDREIGEEGWNEIVGPAMTAAIASWYPEQQMSVEKATSLKLALGLSYRKWEVLAKSCPRVFPSKGVLRAKEKAMLPRLEEVKDSAGKPMGAIVAEAEVETLLKERIAAVFTPKMVARRRVDIKVGMDNTSFKTFSREKVQYEMFSGYVLPDLADEPHVIEEEEATIADERRRAKAAERARQRESKLVREEVAAVQQQAVAQQAAALMVAEAQAERAAAEAILATQSQLFLPGVEAYVESGAVFEGIPPNTMAQTEGGASDNSSCWVQLARKWEEDDVQRRGAELAAEIVEHAAPDEGHPLDIVADLMELEEDDSDVDADEAPMHGSRTSHQSANSPLFSFPIAILRCSETLPDIMVS